MERIWNADTLPFWLMALALAVGFIWPTVGLGIGVGWSLVCCGGFVRTTWMAPNGVKFISQSWCVFLVLAVWIGLPAIIGWVLKALGWR